MEQNLSLNLKQKLNQKLIKNLEILQLSAQELKEVILEEVMENPLIEMDCLEGEDLSFEDMEKFAKFLEGDNFKEDYEESKGNYLEIADDKYTLEDYLLEQISYLKVNENTRKNLEYLAALVDERGYLPLDDIELNDDEKEALKILKTLEPVGVGAKDLQECLILQAKKMEIYFGVFKKILDNHLEDLSKNHKEKIAKTLEVTPKIVENCQDLLKKFFTPKPGAMFSNSKEEYIYPDIFVLADGENIDIRYNDSSHPKIIINNLYKEKNLDIDAKKYLTEKMQNAQNLVLAVENRRRTLKLVADYLINFQRDFFLGKSQYLLGITMGDVAEAIGIHISTVSRCIKGKYLSSPKGIMPLKNLFLATNKNTNANENIEVTRIKEAILDLVNKEDKKKPYSDQFITDYLNKEGFTISRRTVMKYRDSLSIPSSAKRKRY